MPTLLVYEQIIKNSSKMASHICVLHTHVACPEFGSFYSLTSTFTEARHICHNSHETKRKKTTTTATKPSCTMAVKLVWKIHGSFIVNIAGTEVKISQKGQN